MIVRNRNPSLLLSFFDAFGEIDGRKTLHKIIYVLEKKYNIPFTFDFTHTFYGVYSTALQDLVDIMNGMGLIDEEDKKIRLSDEGKTYAMKVREKNRIEYELMKKLSLIETHQYNSMVDEIKKHEKNKKEGREKLSQ